MPSAWVIRRIVKPVVFVAALWPWVWLAGRAALGGLGVNPIEAATLETGRWTLRLLLLTLAVTPIRRLTGWHEIIRLRRMLGLFAFFYGATHAAIYVAVDQFFAWEFVLADIAKRPYITVGVAGFALLVPLAVTSTREWVRRLGPWWRRLHRLVYVSAACGVVHFYWKVKADTRDPLLYAAVLAGLLGLRVLSRLPRGAAVAGWRGVRGRSGRAEQPTAEPREGGSRGVTRRRARSGEPVGP